MFLFPFILRGGVRQEQGESSWLGRRGTSIPVRWGAEDEAAYEKEMERLKQDVERTQPSYSELLQEIASQRVQLRKACAPSQK